MMGVAEVRLQDGSPGMQHEEAGGIVTLAHQILVWSQGKLLSLRAVHIPVHLNMGADILFEAGAEARGIGYFTLR